MTLYGTKEQVEKQPGLYYSLEKELEKWNLDKKEVHEIDDEPYNVWNL
jgi:hypothetical protein